MYEKISDVHVSGHASEEELRYLIRRVHPISFIPVHGEYRHLLRHAEIAIEEGVPPERVLVAEDGDLIELSSDGPRVVRQLEVGKIFVHGKGVGDIGQDVLRERRVLSEVGVVTVVLFIDGETAQLISGPVVQSLGVTFQEVEPELLEGLTIALKNLLEEMRPKTPEKWEDSKEEIRLTVRRNVNRILGRKPLVQTILIHT
jgi:ribonuclease J